MDPKDYTVIIYPPTVSDVNTSTTSPPRVVKVLRCPSPEAAANQADVAPGGRCIVVVEAKYFTRAVKAPLERVDERYEALPKAVHA